MLPYNPARDEVMKRAKAAAASAIKRGQSGAAAHKRARGGAGGDVGAGGGAGASGVSQELKAQALCRQELLALT